MNKKAHYPNLSAEMARIGMNKKEFASCLGVAERTIANKLNGKSEFTISEARKIVSVFPKCTSDYLFAEADEEI